MVTGILFQVGEQAVVAPRHKLEQPDVHQLLTTLLLVHPFEKNPPTWLFEESPLDGWTPALSFDMSDHSFFNHLDSPKTIGCWRPVKQSANFFRSSTGCCCSTGRRIGATIRRKQSVTYLI